MEAQRGVSAHWFLGCSLTAWVLVFTQISVSPLVPRQTTSTSTHITLHPRLIGAKAGIEFLRVVPRRAP
ncbi:hypothetical protein EJ02DRAFT_455135 [Clathrospora elynae]|uniref:Uncharacterized protein n=1 Tax=Clathrospora elynae TaxID=706981 RepID=A0A6A5SP32_9PLEO|nr:hypothetical protein EJ02DRAFT_455135 [Clathrospora elynae]